MRYNDSVCCPASLTAPAHPDCGDISCVSYTACSALTSLLAAADPHTHQAVADLVKVSNQQPGWISLNFNETYQ